MDQATIDFSRRPLPQELFKEGTQDFRLYNRLLSGPVTNEEIADKDGLHIRSYTRRVSDVREALRPHLMDVKAERVRDGLFIYSLKG